MANESPPAPFARFTEHLHRLLVGDRAAILLDRAQRILIRAVDMVRCAVLAEREAARLEASELEQSIAQ